MRASRTNRLRDTPTSAARSSRAATISGSTHTERTPLEAFGSDIPNSLPAGHRPRPLPRSTLRDIMDKTRRE